MSFLSLRCGGRVACRVHKQKRSRQINETNLPYRSAQTGTMWPILIWCVMSDVYESLSAVAALATTADCLGKGFVQLPLPNGEGAHNWYDLSGLVY